MSFFHESLGKSTRSGGDFSREGLRNEARAPRSKRRSLATLELLGALAGVTGYTGVLAAAITEHHGLHLASYAMLVVASLIELGVVWVASTAAK